MFDARRSGAQHDPAAGSRSAVLRAPGPWSLDAWLAAAALLHPDLATELPAISDEHPTELPTRGEPDIVAAIAAGWGADDVRWLARVARVPVLALPARPRAVTGPLVLDARDHLSLPLAMRCVRAERVTFVTVVDPRSSHHESADVVAWREAETASEAAREHGLACESVFVGCPGDAVDVARQEAGLLVSVDPGGGREAPLLARSLRDHRPALVVPRAAARSAASREQWSLEAARRRPQR